MPVRGIRGATVTIADTPEAIRAATRELQATSKARIEASSTVSKLKSQVKEFERDTQRLEARRKAMEAQLRVKEQRANDYARGIGR